MGTFPQRYLIALIKSGALGSLAVGLLAAALGVLIVMVSRRVTRRATTTEGGTGRAGTRCGIGLAGPRLGGIVRTIISSRFLEYGHLIESFHICARHLFVSLAEE